MNFDYSESEEYENDFAAGGEIEFDEIDDTDPGVSFEMELLTVRVQAARACGA